MKYFSFRLAIVFAQSIQFGCEVGAAVNYIWVVDKFIL